MKLIKLALMETPGIEDCICRQYDSDYRGSMIDDVLSATRNGTNINPRTVAEVASRIISPIGDHFDVKIDGGWRNERFKVSMLVELDTQRYSSEYAYIVGYTDGGIRDRTTRRSHSTDVILDPDTRIYINNVTRVSFRRQSHGSSEVYLPSLIGSNQLLRRDAIADSRHGNRPALTRPTDLFRLKDSEVNGSVALDALRNHSGARVDNLVGRFVSNVTFSDINNALSSAHLYKSLKAVISSDSDPSNRSLNGVDLSDRLTGAVDRLDEARLEEDPFFNHMRNDSDIIRSGYVTYSELLDASPDWLDDDTIIIQAHPDDVSRFRDTQRWSGSAPSQIAAQIIANGLPSIMMNAMYSYVDSLIINTSARLGESRVECLMPGPFVKGLDPMSTIDYFEEAVDKILVKDATNNGLFDIFARINADMDGEIKIDISIDHGEMETFIYPTWASGLLSPVMASDSRVLERLSNSITDLANEVASAKNQEARRIVTEPGLTSDPIRSTESDRKPLLNPLNLR